MGGQVVYTQPEMQIEQPQVQVGYEVPEVQVELQGQVGYAQQDVQIKLPTMQGEYELPQVGFAQPEVQCEMPQVQVTYEQSQVPITFELPSVQMTCEEPQIGVAFEQPQGQFGADAVVTYAAPDLSVGFEPSAVEVTQPELKLSEDIFANALPAMSTQVAFFAIAYPTPKPVMATRLLGVAQYIPTRLGENVDVAAVVEGTVIAPSLVMQADVPEVNMRVDETLVVTEATSAIIAPTLQVEPASVEFASPDIVVQGGVSYGEAPICQYAAPEVQGEMQGGVVYTTANMEGEMQAGVTYTGSEEIVQVQYAAPETQYSVSGEVSYNLPVVDGQVQFGYGVQMEQQQEYAFAAPAMQVSVG